MRTKLNNFANPNQKPRQFGQNSLRLANTCGLGLKKSAYAELMRWVFRLDTSTPSVLLNLLKIATEGQVAGDMVRTLLKILEWQSGPVELSRKHNIL